METAEREDRVVLTADRGFIASRLSQQAYFVQATTKGAQLNEVLDAFGISVSQDDLLSRCVKCNGRFLPECGPLESVWGFCGCVCGCSQCLIRCGKGWWGGHS